MISCECNSSHIDTIESQLHRSRFRTFESSLSMVGYLAGGLGPFRNQDWTQRTCQGSGVWGRVMHRLGVRFCFWMMILVLLSCSIFLVVVYEQSSCIINHQYIINISSNLHQPVFIGILRACRVDAVRPRQVLAERAAFLDGSKAKVGRCLRMGQDGDLGP